MDEIKFSCHTELAETRALIEQLKELPVLNMPTDLTKKDWQSIISLEYMSVMKHPPSHIRFNRYATVAATSFLFVAIFAVCHYFLHTDNLLNMPVLVSDEPGISMTEFTEDIILDDTPLGEDLDIATDEEGLYAVKL